MSKNITYRFATLIIAIARDMYTDNIQQSLRLLDYCFLYMLSLEFFSHVYHFLTFTGE